MKLSSFAPKSFFQSFLVLSIVGHATLFGGNQLLMKYAQAPQAFVEQAPSSVDIVIVEEQKIREVVEEEILEEILTTTQESSVTEAVEEKSEVIEEKKQEVTAISNPSQGALQEAKPTLYTNPAPPYPRIARRRGWEGIVILKVLVTSDGKPADVQVDESSGHKVLDDAATKTVKKWIFEPAKLSGIPFQSWARVPIRFILESQK